MNPLNFQSVLKFVTSFASVKEGPNVTFLDGKVIVFGGETLAYAEANHPFGKVPVSVPREKLVAVVNSLPSLPEEEVDLKVEDDVMKIECGSVLAEIPTTNQALVALPSFKKGKSLTGVSLGDALGDVLPAVSQTMLDPKLTCVHFEGGRVEACDGFRMSRYELEEAVFPNSGGILVPGHLLKAISKRVFTAYAVASPWLLLEESEGRIAGVRTYSEKYDDLETCSDVSGNSVEFPAGLEKELPKPAKVFCKDHPDIRVRVADNSLSLYLGGSLGWMQKKFDMEYGGDPIQFSIRSEHLLSALTLGNNLEIGGGRVKISGERFSHVVCISQS